MTMIDTATLVRTGRCPRVLTVAVAMLMMLSVTACDGEDGAQSAAAGVDVLGEAACAEPPDPNPDDEWDLYYECVHETSDPRVSGDVTTQGHCEFTDLGDRTVGECRGTISLINDGGSWEGETSGTTTWTEEQQGHVHAIEMDLTGADGHEGLRYTARLSGLDFPWLIDGRIEPTN